MNQYLSLRWHTLEREYIGRRSDIFAVVLFRSFPAFFPPTDIAAIALPPPSLHVFLLSVHIAENCSPTLLLAGDGHKTAKNVPVFYFLIGPWSVMSVWDFNVNIREAK
jgi:hypothetical protein